MKVHIRARYIFITLGLFIVPLTYILTSPTMGLLEVDSVWAELINYGVWLSRIFLLMVMLHFIRKGMFDYADFKLMLDKAIEDKQAGLAAIALAVMMLSLSLVVSALILTP